jgi:hypothetical protein
MGTTAFAHIADDPSVQEPVRSLKLRKQRKQRQRRHDLTPSGGVVTVPPVLRQPRYLTPGVIAKAAVIAMLALAFVGGGCGPVEYINQVSFKAASALAEAKEAQADKLAPYEYTAAESYLHKAREEASYAQYQDSIEYGRRAEEQAHKARAIALTRMSRSSPAPAPPAPAPGERTIEPPTPKSPSGE